MLENHVDSDALVRVAERKLGKGLKANSEVTKDEVWPCE